MINRQTNPADKSGSRYISYRSDVERSSSPLQLHDPESRDIALANQLAHESVNLSGALVTIYPRTDNESYDKVWEEDADPTYKAGIKIKGYFAPKPLESQLKPWGVDMENQTTIIFCRDEIVERFGKRMVREGDIIELPYNASSRKIDRYRVLNAFDSGNFKYGWLYFSCHVENITDDKNIDITNK